MENRGAFRAEYVNDDLTSAQVAHYAFPPGEQHQVSIQKIAYPAKGQDVARVEGSLDIYNEAIEKAIAHVYFYANSSAPAADYILDVSDVVDGYKVTPKGGEHNPRYITFNIENWVRWVRTVIPQSPEHLGKEQELDEG